MHDQAERPIDRVVPMRSFVAALIAIALLSAACDRGGDPEAPGEGGGFGAAASAASPTPSETFAPSSSAPSPTQPADPGPRPTRGVASEGCVEGWTTPARGTPLFTDPLGIIRRAAPVDGDFVVTDMRYFSGPESPPSDKGYILEINRWYIKLYVDGDWSYQGRFLVEQRVFGRGVAAVAPYDSKGFRSPDWTGFQWDSADTEARAYPGLPGQWPGIPYDFVRGGAGLDIPGLPAEVRGCLQGT